MNPSDPFHIEQRLVRMAFDNAAAQYDAAAVLQREVRARLIERLEWVKLTPAIVLDAGCGTGAALGRLQDRYPDARIVAGDLSEGMLHEVQRRGDTPDAAVCFDAARLPFADESVDVIFSNLMLQWCDDPDAVFGECRRVLRPHGLLTFTTFGPDTLGELRAAWSEVDGYNHVNRFIDMHDLGDAMVRAGLAEPVMDVEHITLTYDDAIGLMRDLKAIGAHNVTDGRPRGLTGRARLRQLAEAYETFRHEGKLPATWEVIYGQAWGPTERSRVVGGDVEIPLSRLRRGR